MIFASLKTNKTKEAGLREIPPFSDYLLSCSTIGSSLATFHRDTVYLLRANWIFCSQEKDWPGLFPPLSHLCISTGHDKEKIGHWLCKMVLHKCNWIPFYFQVHIKICLLELVLFPTLPLKLLLEGFHHLPRNVSSVRVFQSCTA